MRPRRRLIGRGRLVILLSVVVCGLLIAVAAGGRGASGYSTSAAIRGRGLPQAGVIVGTLHFPVRETPLFAARAGSLFVFVAPSRRAASITVMRVDPGGAITRRRVPFALSYYLMDVSTGPDGVYAGTAVVKRFTDVPDVLVRLDPKTLTIRARASFPSRVAAVEHGPWVWASIGDGRVVRLDPLTLATKASRRLLSPAAVTTRGLSLSKPALGLGSLWLLAGNKLDLELVRLDPLSLAVRSKTRLPINVARAAWRVVADPGHAYLVGGTIVGIDARGKLIGHPVAVPDLATADIHGSGLVGLTAANPALVLLDAHGRIVARTGVRDDSLLLAVSGENVWFLGDAGRGNGIVHVHLSSG